MDTVRVRKCLSSKLTAVGALIISEEKSYRCITIRKKCGVNARRRISIKFMERTCVGMASRNGNNPPAGVHSQGVEDVGMLRESDYFSSGF